MKCDKCHTENPAVEYPTPDANPQEYWEKLNTMLDSKISTLETKIDGAIATQDVKIKVLQTKCEQYEEDIAALKSIVSKQQRSLNSIDDEERSKNLIITGIY